MHLPSNLLKLPLQLDSERLAYEVSQIPRSEWTTNPSGLAGNSGLILVSVNGEINDDFAIAGQMQATKHLTASPYMQQVLAALKAPISRSRLMILAPGASAGIHLDARYHWYRRIRIHIPVFTNPTVSFTCNGETVHMKLGEVWTFNGAKPHTADNSSDLERVHMVVDTIGSTELSYMLENANTLPEKYVAYEPNKQAEIEIENYFFEVLTPEEVTMMLNNIHEYVAPQLNENERNLFVDHLERMKQQWRNAFNEHGHNISGKAAYQQLIEKFTEEVKKPFGSLIPKLSMNRFYMEVICGMLTTTNRV